MMMIDVDPKIKKKKGAEYFERPEDLDSDWMKAHQEAEVEELRQKITKKFEKDNEKLAAEGEKEMKPKELNERLEKADELAAKYKKENKTGKIEAEGKGPSIDKLETAVDKLNQRIENMKVQMEDKEGNKEVALGTSKIVSQSNRTRQVRMLIGARTTLTLVSPWFSPRSLTSLSRSSSRRHSGRSLTGPSNPSTKTGSFRHVFGYVRCTGGGIGHGNGVEKHGWLCKVFSAAFGFLHSSSLQVSTLHGATI
jgi:hypothetical protein